MVILVGAVVVVVCSRVVGVVAPLGVGMGGMCGRVVGVVDCTGVLTPLSTVDEVPSVRGGMVLDGVVP
ncbi:MAG: hypothetical protein ACLQPH_13020 [Acidimicrobiales bacterium]